MAQEPNIRAQVRSFILSHFLVGEREDSLKDSTPLLTTGIVSSIAMLELVAFIEEEYSILLGQDDLTPERLDNVERIVDLVEKLSQQQRELT